MSQRKVDKFIVEVTVDEYAESPREWEKVGTLYLPNAGDENISDLISECNSNCWNDILVHVVKNGGMAYPVSKYEHGGVSYFVGTQSGWDISFVGVYVIDNVEDAKERYLTDENGLKEMVESELEEFTQWVNGDVYAVNFEAYYKCAECGSYFKADDKDCWACCGYFGTDMFKEDVLEVVENYRKKSPDAIFEYVGEMKYLFE